MTKILTSILCAILSVLLFIVGLEFIKEGYELHPAISLMTALVLACACYALVDDILSTAFNKDKEDKVIN